MDDDDGAPFHANGPAVKWDDEGGGSREVEFRAICITSCSHYMAYQDDRKLQEMQRLAGCYSSKPRKFTQDWEKNARGQILRPGDPLVDFLGALSRCVAQNRRHLHLAFLAWATHCQRCMQVGNSAVDVRKL